MSNAWSLVILTGLLALLAGYAAHCGQIAQEAQEERDTAIKANRELHKQVADLQRYTNKQNYHISNLMVENYELYKLVDQAHSKGFIPQQFKHGREN